MTIDKLFILENLININSIKIKYPLGYFYYSHSIVPGGLEVIS